MNLTCSCCIIYTMKDFKKGVKYLAIAMQIGIDIALPIASGIYIGAYLDQRFSTGSAFLICGFLLGLGSSIAVVYRLIIYQLNNKDENKK